MIGSATARSSCALARWPLAAAILIAAAVLGITTAGAQVATTVDSCPDAQWKVGTGLPQRRVAAALAAGARFSVDKASGVP